MISLKNPENLNVLSKIRLKILTLHVFLNGVGIKRFQTGHHGLICRSSDASCFFFVACENKKVFGRYALDRG